MNQSQKITEGALYSTVFVILLVVTLLVPGAILLLPFLLPIPFIIYAHKYNWQPTLLMLAVTLLISFMILPVFSVPLTILAASGGIIIGSFMNQKKSAYETWISGTSGYIIGLLLIFVFTQVVLDISWVAQLDQTLAESIEMSKQMMNQLGMGEQSEESIQLLEETVEMMKDLIPVAIAGLAILMAFISQWVGYKVLNRIEQTRYRFPAFRNLKFPVSIIWIYLASLLLILFVNNMDGFLFIAANNVQSLIRILMVLQGLSFIFFYSHSKKWSKSIPVLVTVFTFILPFLFFYIIGLLGLIDLGFGLRDRVSKKEDLKK